MKSTHDSIDTKAEIVQAIERKQKIAPGTSVSPTIQTALKTMSRFRELDSQMSRAQRRTKELTTVMPWE